MDCRSFDPSAYKADIIEKRAERFSTVFAVQFLSSTNASTQQQEQLLAVAYSTGYIKLFRVRDAVSSWLGRSVPTSACLTWKAHAAPVMSLACLDQGTPSAMLVSGGEDGTVRAWPLSMLLLHTQPASTPSGGSSPPPSFELRPSFEGHISKGSLGSVGPPSGVMCSTVDAEGGHLLAGSTDGVVYVFDVRAASAATFNSKQGPAQLPCIAILAGHFAGVLCIDVCSRAGLVASGSEDGTLRIWDLKRGLAGSQGPASPVTLHPTHTICPSLGGPVSPTVSSQLQCARSAQPVTAARFQDAGWVVCGLGGKVPSLALWSLDAEALAMRVPLPCVPQVLVVQPGEILLAGSAPSLYRFSFTGELTSQFNLASPAQSIFALDVLPGDPAGVHKAGHVAPGAIALGGTGGSWDLLSRFGTQLAVVFPPSLGLED